MGNDKISNKVRPTTTYHAPVGSQRKAKSLTPATLLKAGAATLLTVSGAQGRTLLAGDVAPAVGPAAPQPAAAARLAPAPVAPPAVFPGDPIDILPAPAPLPAHFNPFAIATAAQNANLMGSTQNATVFNRDVNGRIVIRATDVHQDIVHEGDCQTLSVLASVARQNSTLIQNHLQEFGRNDNNTNLFGIQIFVGGNWTQQNVTDVDLPGRGALQKTDVIWPRLYEAALIQAFPNDDVLNKHLVDASQPSSGKPSIDTGKVLNAVTGLPLKAGDGDGAANDLMDAVSQGSAATAGVNQGDVNWFGSFDTVDPQSGNKVDISTPGAVTILGSHQYGVLNVTQQAPGRQVALFNPYNYPTAGGSVFTVNESVFREYFVTGLAWT